MAETSKMKRIFIAFYIIPCTVFCKKQKKNPCTQTSQISIVGSSTKAQVGGYNPTRIHTRKPVQAFVPCYVCQFQWLNECQESETPATVQGYYLHQWQV